MRKSSFGLHQKKDDKLKIWKKCKQIIETALKTKTENLRFVQKIFHFLKLKRRFSWTTLRSAHDFEFCHFVSKEKKQTFWKLLHLKLNSVPKILRRFQIFAKMFERSFENENSKFEESEWKSSDFYKFKIRKLLSLPQETHLLALWLSLSLKIKTKL